MSGAIRRHWSTTVRVSLYGALASITVRGNPRADFLDGKIYWRLEDLRMFWPDGTMIGNALQETLADLKPPTKMSVFAGEAAMLGGRAHAFVLSKAKAELEDDMERIAAKLWLDKNAGAEE